MKHTYKLVLFLLTVLTAQVASSQGREARLRMNKYVSPDEMVSVESTLTIDQALAILDTMSEKFVGKIIDCPGTHTGKIGVWIQGEHWHDAMEKILKYNGLWYKEEARFIRVAPLEGEVKGGTAVPPAGGTLPPGEKPGERLPTLDNRDVRISAVFFRVNVTRAQSYGISWNFYRAPTTATSNQPTVDVLTTLGMGKTDTLVAGPTIQRGTVSDAMASVVSAPQFTFANINALVKFFGQNNLGEVLTSPDLIVRDGKEGHIEVGQTIFLTSKDFAGNTVNKDYPSGTIITVTPTIYTQSDTDFIYLNLMIEQSSVDAGPVINRAQVKTHALLFDGEETVIGGLMSTSESELREGIPFLKDLPWWFFGLRYIFGAESKQKVKDELVILLKAELISPIRQRISEKSLQQNLIEKKRKEYQIEFEKKQ